MPSCVVFLALAFIFLNQYNRVHEVLCVLYARHLSLAPRRRLCVQSKMIKLSIFIYFFPSFFFFRVQTFWMMELFHVMFLHSTWECESMRKREEWGEVKICKMYTSMYTSQKGTRSNPIFPPSHKCPTPCGPHVKLLSEGRKKKFY